MKKYHFEKLDFLIAFYIFCLIAAETLGGKTFPVLNIGTFHLNASVSIFLIPLIFSVNDIITEVYGPEKTRGIIRLGLMMVALLFLFTAFAVALPPSARYAKTEPSYDVIFSQSARISLASLVAFAASDFLDVYVFSKIRKRFGKKALWFRNNASNIIAQLVDSTVFITLAFYVIGRPIGDNLVFLAGLIIPYWFLKCFMSVIETPLVYIGVKWLKK